MGKFKKNNAKTNADACSKRLAKSKGKITFEKTVTPKRLKNKKEKLKNKKKDLLKKIILVKEQQKEETARKKREKTAITGDLKPLMDALPSLDELLQLKSKEVKTGLEQTQNTDNSRKLNKSKRIKKRKQEFMNRYNSFQTLLKDPDFKKNPRETIAFHIRCAKRNRNMKSISEIGAEQQTLKRSRCSK